MSKKYVLNGHDPVECHNLTKWATWFETASNRVVKQEMIGDVQVSTVFLGIDHRLVGDGPPILFETMVFGGLLSESQERYCVWDEAMAGHKRWVKKVKTVKAEV